MSAFFLVTYVALWVLSITELVALLALYDHFGQMYLSGREGRDKQGPALGSEMRPVELQDVRGTPVRLPVRESPTLILLASTVCRECDKIKPALAELSARYSTEVVIAVLCAGKREAVSDWAGAIAMHVTVIPDPGYKVAAKLGVGMTPYVIGVDAAGKVCDKGLVNEREGMRAAIEDLIAKSQPVVWGGVGS